MRFLALFLTALTAVNPVWAQTTPGEQRREADPQPALRVRVVDDVGPGLPNSTSLKGYAIQVTDSSGGPVADAAVAMRLPEEGATGHFGGGLRSWVTYTDPAGLARFPMIEWEGSVGLAELKVTAAKGTVHAGLLVQHQVGTGKSARVLAPTVTVAEVPRAEVPRAELPRAPELSVETPQPSQALADVVPMPVSNGTATAPKEIGLIDRGHALTPDSASTAQTHASSPEPAVSITNSGTGAGSQGGSRKKWMVIAAIGAAAGVGGFLALSGHGGSGSKSSSTGVAIGTPTISVSH